MSASEIRATLAHANELASDPANGPWVAIGYMEAVMKQLAREAEREEREAVGEGERKA